MTAPLLSCHAAKAGLANMAAAISATETSLLIASSFDLASGLGRISVWKFMASTWPERCCTKQPKR
jgi:hypothetical protein